MTVKMAPKCKMIVNVQLDPEENWRKWEEWSSWNPNG